MTLLYPWYIFLKRGVVIMSLKHGRLQKTAWTGKIWPMRALETVM